MTDLSQYKRKQGETMQAQLIISRDRSGQLTVECDTDGYAVRVPDPTGPPELIDQGELWNQLSDMVGHMDYHNGDGKYA